VSSPPIPIGLIEMRGGVALVTDSAWWVGSALVGVPRVNQSWWHPLRPAVAQWLQLQDR